MINTQRDRHTIEYEIIPEYIYSENATDFINTILIKHQRLIIDMYNRINRDVSGYICPYKDSDFVMDAVVIGNIAGIMRVKMPPALQAGDIIRMYICHDQNLENAVLYTVRVDEDYDTCFMTWVDDSHYRDHGKFKTTESKEMQTVTDFYMKFLGGK